MKHPSFLRAVLALTLLTACPRSLPGHCDTSEDCPNGNVCDTELQLCFRPDPTFALKVAQADKRVIRGEPLKIAVEVERQGLTEPITLTVEGLPEFVTAARVQIAEGQTTAEVSVATSLNAAPGKVEATLVAVAGDKRQALPVSFELRFPPGMIDGSFGKAGVVGQQGDAMASARWRAMTLTQNREVLLAGGSEQLKLRVALLDAKGRPVPSFNAGQSLTLDDLGEGFAVNASRPDRFLVMCGSGAESQLRWLGRDGASQAWHAAPFQAFWADLSVLSNGGIFVATGNSVFRLLPSGEPDSALGPRGVRGVSIPSSTVPYNYYSEGKALRLRNGGSLHASSAGGLEPHPGPEGGIMTPLSGAFLTRLKEDHTVDRSFGTEGTIASHARGPARPELGFDALLETSDGKIITATARADGVAVFRFLPSGALDMTFGQKGVALLPLKDYSPAALAQQSDGKLLVAGEGQYNPFLTRLNPDGSLDLGFGDKGSVLAANGSFNDAGWTTMVLDGDDGILVAGQAGGNNKRFAIVARFFQ